MSLFTVLATGQSMNQEMANFVRGKCNVVAVSDAYKLAPWADALVSNDAGWWRAHPDAMNFAGQKYCGVKYEGTITVKRDIAFESSCNSGLLGMRVARDLGATTILLLGFDMHGTHFFGAHPKPLSNTTAQRFAVHRGQFRRWNALKDKCPVINCTPGSALKLFPFDTLENALADYDDLCENPLKMRAL